LSSQSSISCVNETFAAEQRTTDSPRWIRLIASAISGATDKVVILPSRLPPAVAPNPSGRSRAGLERIRRQPGRSGTPCVARRIVRSRQRPRDLVSPAVSISSSTMIAASLDVADDVHQLGPIEVPDPPFLDDREGASRSSANVRRAWRSPGR